MSNRRHRTIRRTTAVDGTVIELRELPDGRYMVTDGDGERFEDPVRSVDRGIEQFEETERFVSQGARSQQSRRSEPPAFDRDFRDFGSEFGGGFGDEGLLGGFGDSGEGGFFGNADDDDRDDSNGLLGWLR